MPSRYQHLRRSIAGQDNMSSGGTKGSPGVRPLNFAREREIVSLIYISQNLGGRAPGHPLDPPLDILL